MTLPEEYHEMTESSRNLSDVRHKTPFDRHDMLVIFKEPSPADGVLTQDGVSQIAYHKYRAGEYTFVDQFLNPIWTYLTELLPIWMAPNLVTATGGLCCLAAYILTWYYVENLDQPAQDWLLMVNAMSMIVYYTLDCMDGKQARRTGSSSPLGQLFDHGVDCLCLIVHLSSIQCWLVAESPTYFGIQAILQFSFFVAQWEEYFTGILPHATGQIGVTEVNYGLALATLFNAFIDRSVYATPLVDLLPAVVFDERWNQVIVQPVIGCRLDELLLRHLMAMGWYTMMTMLICLSIGRVWGSLSSVSQRLAALGKLITPLALAVAPLYLPPAIQASNQRLISLSVGLALGLITIKLIVFSMARQAYAVVQFDAAPALAAVVWTKYDTRLTDDGVALVWRLLVAFYVWRLWNWTTSAIQQICRRLEIQLFTIKTKTE